MFKCNTAGAGLKVWHGYGREDESEGKSEKGEKAQRIFGTKKRESRFFLIKTEAPAFLARIFTCHHTMRRTMPSKDFFSILLSSKH